MKKAIVIAAVVFTASMIIATNVMANENSPTVDDFIQCVNESEVMMEEFRSVANALDNTPIYTIGEHNVAIRNPVYDHMRSRVDRLTRNAKSKLDECGRIATILKLY